MFCNKCGKELPDTAQFCSGCGNQIGAVAQPAPSADAAPAQVPVIFKRLITNTVDFFTKKDPAAAVTRSAKDSSFSGIIMAIFGMLMFALGAMVNINQGMLSYAKQVMGDFYSSSYSKLIAESFPSGASFGMMLLFAFIVYAVAVVMIFVAANYVAKKPLTLSGACNLVAYSSIPVIIISILNMLFGLIWFVLPVLFMLVAVVASVVILATSLNKAVETDKPLTVNLLVFAVTAVVALIFLWISLKTINGAKDSGAIVTGISNWFFEKD